MISKADIVRDIQALLYSNPLDIDDDDLDACAAALRNVYLKVPVPLSNFNELDDEDKEDYRELAMAVINTLRERL